MEITLKYYNLVSEVTGKTTERFPLPEGKEGLTLAELLELLIQRYGKEMGKLLFREPRKVNPSLLILANGQLLTRGEGNIEEMGQQFIGPGAEIALLSAIAGG
ncbi:MoaD/ThiS family protein [Thermanaeromonas sp. C210]|uniref:MoaD/ThiS family protein n=1 Tax=Thermanaeromonas sp. C210 TaxID=2731925 RepID=UPI00155CE950|nr:MoaD/ThiS family protein [Thermanaeromonas sp. C210]GFN23920.1 hypothetical protein TAMC210_22370 [Thermanaeromonas sp. C210]